MNSDGELIPIVEDDQGEGFKDPWDELKAVEEEHANLMQDPFWLRQHKKMQRKNAWRKLR